MQRLTMDIERKQNTVAMIFPFHPKGPETAFEEGAEDFPDQPTR